MLCALIGSSNQLIQTLYPAHMYMYVSEELLCVLQGALYQDEAKLYKYNVCVATCTCIHVYMNINVLYVLTLRLGW